MDSCNNINSSGSSSRDGGTQPCRTLIPLPPYHFRARQAWTSTLRRTFMSTRTWRCQCFSIFYFLLFRKWMKQDKESRAEKPLTHAYATSARMLENAMQIYCWVQSKEHGTRKLCTGDTLEFYCTKKLRVTARSVHNDMFKWTNICTKRYSSVAHFSCFPITSSLFLFFFENKSHEEPFR